MINKSSFVKIIDSVRDYWDSIFKLEKALNIQIDENFMTKIVDNMLNAISDDVEAYITRDDNVGTWIYYYAFELDFGRKDFAGDAVSVDGVVYPLTTAEQLYDFLLVMNYRDGAPHDCEQIRWERDIAMQQLKDHGIPFGSKADNVVKVIRCKNCENFDLLDDGLSGFCTDCNRCRELGDFCSYGESKEDN